MVVQSWAGMQKRVVCETGMYIYAVCSRPVKLVSALRVEPWLQRLPPPDVEDVGGGDWPTRGLPSAMAYQTAPSAHVRPLPRRPRSDMAVEILAVAKGGGCLAQDRPG